VLVVVRISVIVVPVPLPLPATVPLRTTEVQLNVVPVTRFGFVMTILVACPLHNDVLAGALALGIGLTVTLTVVDALVQPPVVEVAVIT
jgi:hypothetical protein